MTTERLLRLPAVEAATGLRRSAIYDLAQQGKFPRPVKLTARSSAWRESLVERWIAERIQASEGEIARAKHGPARRT
jgi:prophage regulatory protein